VPGKTGLADEVGTIRVRVASADSAWQGEIELVLVAGATIADALASPAVLAQCPADQLTAARCGIWGRTKSRQQILRDQDRIELYRPLQADPKAARRAKVAVAKSS
jgi:putative ubiquitin-RnfH superfamily antitoxin RatB of RatAB toxin-antitoxin module